MIKKSTDSEIFDIFIKNHQRYLSKRASGAEGAMSAAKAARILLKAAEDVSILRNVLKESESLYSSNMIKSFSELDPKIARSAFTREDLSRSILAALKSDVADGTSLVQKLSSKNGYKDIADFKQSFDKFFKDLRDLRPENEPAFSTTHKKELEFLLNYKNKTNKELIEAAEISAAKNISEDSSIKIPDETTEKPKATDSEGGKGKSPTDDLSIKPKNKSDQPETPTTPASTGGKAWELMKSAFKGLAALAVASGALSLGLYYWGGKTLYSWLTRDKEEGVNNAIGCLQSLALKEGSEADKRRDSLVKDFTYLIEKLSLYKNTQNSNQYKNFADFLGSEKESFAQKYKRITGNGDDSVAGLLLYISNHPEEVDESVWSQILALNPQNTREMAGVAGGAAGGVATGAALTAATLGAMATGAIVGAVVIGTATYFVSDVWTDTYKEVEGQKIQCILDGIGTFVELGNETVSNERESDKPQTTGPIKSVPFDRTDLTQDVAGLYIDLKVNLGDSTNKTYLFRMKPEYDFKSNNFPLGFGDSLVKAVKLLGTLPGRALIGDVSSSNPALALGIIPSGNTMEDRIAAAIVFIIENNIDSAKKLNSYIKEIHNLGIGDTMFRSYKGTVKKETGAPRAFMSDLLNLSTSKATVELIGKRLKQSKNSINNLHKTSNTIINHSIGGDLNLNKVAQQKISYFSNATKGLKDQLAQSYYAGYDDFYNQKPEKKSDNYNELYDFQKETGKDLIQSAHPRSIYLADAIGNGGLVENSLEQSDRTHSVALSVPSGNFINRYAQVVDRLTKLAKTAKEQNKPEALILINQTIKNIQKLGE